MIATILISAGTLLGLRYLWFLWQDSGAGHIQSLILAAILLGAGFNVMLTAFVADLLSVNRKLSEEIRLIVKKINSQIGERDSK